jgi:ADP-heptose:LPS heptosyltransferase
MTKSLIRIRGFIFQILSFVLSYIPSRKKDRYDLVIMRVDAVGDYIIWHDSLSAYEDVFCGKRVLLICADVVKPLAEKEAFFSNIIEVDRNKCWNNFFYLIRLLRRVKSVTSSVAINPSWERHVRGDAIFKQINSSCKIGMAPQNKKGISYTLFDSQYTQLISYNESSCEIKAVEYFTQKVINPKYKYGLNPIKPTLTSIKGIPNHYAVIAFSSAIKERSWEIEKFSDVIDSIPLQYGVILTGAGTLDYVNASQIIKNVQNKDRIINLVNKLSIYELINIIGGADFLVGNDSAPVHIAAATHVRSICVCPGGHYGRFLPYPEDMPFPEFNPIVVAYMMDCFGCGHNCIYEESIPFFCLKKVSAQRVISELKIFTMK